MGECRLRICSVLIRVTSWQVSGPRRVAVDLQFGQWANNFVVGLMLLSNWVFVVDASVVTQKFAREGVSTLMSTGVVQWNCLPLRHCFVLRQEMS